MRSSEPGAPRGESAALIGRHAEIWALMGLSPNSVEELDRLVLRLHERLNRARSERAEPAAPGRNAERDAEPALTRAEYLKRHRQRFDALGISPSTRDELLAAASFTWNALHDASRPQERRAAAETLRSLMLAMGGPPPCCDDGLLQWARQDAPCP